MPDRADSFIALSACVRREFSALLRSPRVVLVMVAFAGVLILICAFSYPSGGASATQFGVRYAQTMVSVQLFGLWIAALTALPAMAVLGFHQEADAGTLEHIACTPLDPRTIYWSKALALVALYVLVTASVLPISGVAFFLAGVEVQPYLGQLATLLCLAVCITAISLHTAVRVVGALSALVRALAIGLTAGGGLLTLFVTYHLGAVTAYMLGLSLPALLRPNPFGKQYWHRAIPFPSNPQAFRMPDTIPLDSIRRWLPFTRARGRGWVEYAVFIFGLAAIIALAFSGGLAYLNSVVSQLPHLLDLAAFLLGVVICHLLGFTARRNRPPHSSAQDADAAQSISTRGTRRAVHRPLVPFRDADNPIAAKERLLSTHRHDYPRMGCILFPLGFVAVIISFLGAFGGPRYSLALTRYAADLLIYGSAAVTTAAVFFRDCDRSTLDALRATLLSEREFLDGKVRATWRAYVPLLAGFYAAEVLVVLLLIQSFYGPAELACHCVLIALTIPELHFVLLLTATGATFGHSAVTRIVSAILWSVPGMFLPDLATDYLEEFTVRRGFTLNYNVQYGMFVLTYGALLGVAVILALLLARWRFRRLWQGAGE